MVRTQDGFELAELDLSLRGPGEFFGTRQAGLPDFRVANLLRDRQLLELAKLEAARFADTTGRRGDRGRARDACGRASKRPGNGGMGWSRRAELSAGFWPSAVGVHADPQAPGAETISTGKV